MRKLKVAILVTLALALCALTLSGQQRELPKFVDAYVYEPVIRGEAINAPMPVYPEEAISAGAQGLVDLAVLFDEKGKTKIIKILESPHPAITKAVKDGVNQWTQRTSVDSVGLPIARLESCASIS
jgi:Gram-negative bacterial TonB protein C-terminal